MWVLGLQSWFSRVSPVLLPLSYLSSHAVGVIYPVKVTMTALQNRTNELIRKSLSRRAVEVDLQIRSPVQESVCDKRNQAYVPSEPQRTPVKLTVTCHSAEHLHSHPSGCYCGNKAPGTYLRWQSGGGGTLIRLLPSAHSQLKHTGQSLLTGSRASRKSEMQAHLQEVTWCKGRSQVHRRL